MLGSLPVVLDERWLKQKKFAWVKDYAPGGSKASEFADQNKLFNDLFEGAGITHQRCFIAHAPEIPIAGSKFFPREFQLWIYQVDQPTLASAYLSHRGDNGVPYSQLHIDRFLKDLQGIMAFRDVDIKKLRAEQDAKNEKVTKDKIDEAQAGMVEEMSDALTADPDHPAVREVKQKHGLSKGVRGAELTGKPDSKGSKQ